jgi:hypothetical protein
LIGGRFKGEITETVKNVISHVPWKLQIPKNGKMCLSKGCYKPILIYGVEETLYMDQDRY